MPHSSFGGRHELGQNFLHHKPTLRLIVELAARTSGEILEIGPGDGAVTRRLLALRRPLTAIELDERRVAKLKQRFPEVCVRHGDVLQCQLDSPTIVGNLPFHLTTPILRRLLAEGTWQNAVLMTQWEVAKKRASVGGGTLMSAQAAPWFEISLEGRVPAWGFTPRPSVDGGIITINRRKRPLIAPEQRPSYERLVRRVFTGRGKTFTAIFAAAARIERRGARRVLLEMGIDPGVLPRQIRPKQWAGLWNALEKRKEVMG